MVDFAYFDVILRVILLQFFFIAFTKTFLGFLPFSPSFESLIINVTMTWLGTFVSSFSPNWMDLRKHRRSSPNFDLAYRLEIMKERNVYSSEFCGSDSR